MSGRGWTRREILAGTGASLMAPAALAAAAEPKPAELPFPKDTAEALARLKAGNARFAEGKTHHAHESADWRKHLVAGQKPFATVIGCSDSRVPTELVFDQGFGDLFVIRVAGNVIAPDVVGSVEYAVAHLKTRLLVIMGHQGCGAVTAAVQALAGKFDELPGIRELVKMIEPGLPKDLLKSPMDQQVATAVEANVRWSIAQMSRVPCAKAALEAKEIMIVGAVYDLATGQVRFLPAG